MSSLWVYSALGTALCFAVSSLVAYEAARALGALAFSFARMSVVAITFAFLIYTLGFDYTLDARDLALLIISGFFGVLISDTFRYSSLSRVGPSLQSLLNTTTSPFSVLLGFLLLGQILSGLSLLGTLIVFTGLLIALVSRNSDELSQFSGDREGTYSGIAFGLASALAQAGSVLIAAPVMLNGADPVSATFVRSSAGAISLIVPILLSEESRNQVFGMSRLVFRQVVLSATIGTGLGMTLQLYALKHGPVGIVSTLTSTTPLLILPLVWILGRSRPGVLSWIGALLAVAGVAMIVNSK